MPANIGSLVAVSLTALFLNTGPGHKFGYIDKQGKEVIPAKYLMAYPFQNGFARCYGTDPKTGKDDWTNLVFIDKEGHEYKLQVKAEDADPSKPHTFRIDGKEIREDRSETEVVEKNGMKLVRSPYAMTLVIPGEKRTIDATSLGWKGINRSTGNHWFFKDGQASEFTGAVGKSSVPGLEPVAIPQLIDQWCGIKTAMNEKYDYFGELSDGLIAARSRSKRWYYLTRDGSVAIELPANVCSAQPFSEGLAAVAIGGAPWSDMGGHSNISPLKGAKFGFIDKTGKFAIPPMFSCPLTDWHSTFKDGFALATAEKNVTTALGYINTKGEFVVPAKYLRLDDFSEGLAAFDANPVGFDSEEWKTGRRKDIAQFLRQYNIFSMRRSQVKSLLGEPSEQTKFPDADAYFLSGGCLGSTYIAIRYDAADRVAGYTMSPNFWAWKSLTTNQTPPTEWIVSDQKPDVDEYFVSFFQRANKQTFIPPIVKPKSDRTANEVFRSTFLSPLGQLPFDSEFWKHYPEKRRYMLFCLVHSGLYKKSSDYIEQLLGKPDRIITQWRVYRWHYSLKLRDYETSEICFDFAPGKQLHNVLLHFRDESGIETTRETAWCKSNPTKSQAAADINKHFALVGMPIENAHALGFRTVEVASHCGPDSPIVEVIATPDKSKVEKLRVNFAAAKLPGYRDYTEWEERNFYPNEKLVFLAAAHDERSDLDLCLLLPDKPFSADGWKENHESRYSQLFDLTHQHKLIGKSREEVCALLGQPDKKQPESSQDCDYYPVRKSSDGEFFQIAYKDNCAVAYRVGYQHGDPIHHQKVWQNGGGLYADNSAARKRLAPMLTRVVKWQKNATGEWEPVR